MFKNKFFVFTIVLLFLLSIGLVSANENSTDNVLDDSIQNADDILSSVEISDVVQANQSSSSSEGSFNDLQNLVSNAEDGDTINLDKDYVYSDGDSKGIVVKKSLTIDGSNHEIDGMRQSGIFLLGDTNSRITVILKNIKFLDAYDEMGSVIKIAHSTKKITLNIDNCTFENNRAEYNGGVIYIYDEKKVDGYPEGAIVNSYLTITNSKFINNKAEDSGAIYSQGQSTTIKNSIFKNNQLLMDMRGQCILVTNKDY